MSSGDSRAIPSTTTPLDGWGGNEMGQGSVANVTGVFPAMLQAPQSGRH